MVLSEIRVNSHFLSFPFFKNKYCFKAFLRARTQVWIDLGGPDGIS